MRLRIAAAAALIPMTAFGAGVAHADTEWEMPYFLGMTLDEARGAWDALTDGEGPEMSTRIVHSAPGIPMNSKSWKVCGQKPHPGESVDWSTSIAVAVSPPGMC